MKASSLAANRSNIESNRTVLMGADLGSWPTIDEGQIKDPKNRER